MATGLYSLAFLFGCMVWLCSGGPVVRREDSAMGLLDRWRMANQQRRLGTNRSIGLPLKKTKWPGMGKRFGLANKYHALSADHLQTGGDPWVEDLEYLPAREDELGSYLKKRSNKNDASNKRDPMSNNEEMYLRIR